MPINVQCKGCSQKFQAPDESAGKQVKCPSCSALIEIPSPDEQTRIAGKRPAQPASLKTAQQLSPEQLRALEKKRTARREAIEAKLAETAGDETEPESGPDPLEELAQTELPEWHVQTDDGEEYGPVTKAELEEWVLDGRLDQTCQVIHEDWDQWKWAEEVFPDLAEAAEPESDSPFDQWAAVDTQADAAPVIADVETPTFQQEASFPQAAGPTAATARTSVRTSARTSTPTRGRQRRYPALTMTAKIYEILAWIVGGMGLLLVGLIGLAIVLVGRDPMTIGSLIMAALMVLLYTFLAVITMRAVVELIGLLFNLENDNQALAETVQQLAQSISKQGRDS